MRWPADILPSRHSLLMAKGLRGRIQPDLTTDKASASAALGSEEWARAFVEVYLFVAAIYLVFGYALSRYGGYLEAKMDRALIR